MSWNRRVVALTSCACLLLPSAIAQAQTLWTEGAENGLAHVIDGTDASYSLIQSDVVAKGNYAFHLANPDFQDNWFEIDQNIAVQADTKLFFLSQLSWATTSQVAKVQASTNGGASWPIELYSQAGDNGAGEGAFSLREIQLGTYAEESLRFRFMYDFTGGSAYPQTTTDVGWRIDDIQVGAELEKIQFSVGNPSPDEQLYLEYINRARADAILEAERLAAETDPDVTSAYDFFNVDPQDIIYQFTTSVNDGCLDRFAQPLSFNEELLLAAGLHSEDMFNNQFQGHFSSSNPPAPLLPGSSLGDRLDAVGYQGGAGENVYAYADSVNAGHAGFDVDWGDTFNPSHPCYNPAFAGQGMQNGAGHRHSIHNDEFKEIGVGVVNGTNGSVGPQVVTQDFGNPGDVTYITGVVYEDLNGNEFYDIGEGRPGVRVDVDGSAYYAVSSESGAYSVPVSDDGTYVVEFTGGGFGSYSAMADVVDGRNVKIDYLAFESTFLAADYNENGMVDMADYTIWKQTFGSTDDLRADGNGDMAIDLADFTVWRDALGQTSNAPAFAAQTVPEPSSVAILTAGLLATLASRWRRQTIDGTRAA